MTPAFPEPLHPAARELPPPATLASLSAGRAVGRLGGIRPVAWPEKVKRRYSLIPTICFNCEAACGLLAYVDHKTLRIQKFEGNPVHPGSRGRNCAKGPATLNQVEDPERILYPLRRTGPRGGGQWERVTWDEVLDDIGGAHPQGAGRGPPEGSDVPPRAGPATSWCTCSACSTPGASTATTATPTSARPARAPATRSGTAWTGPRPITPTRGSSCCCPRTWRPATTSTRTPSGSSRPRCAAPRSPSSTRGCRNTASMADFWLAPWPGSEAALLLAMAHVLVREHRYDREFVRRWVNWEEYLREERPDLPVTFDAFHQALDELYASYTPEFAAQESGVDPATIVERRPGRRRRRLRARHAHLAQHRRRQPRAAGRWRARWSCSWSWSAPSARRAAPRPAPGTRRSRRRR